MCKENMFDADSTPCACRMAVERCYKTLTAAGEPQTIALQAAKRVYRHHHPEDSIEEAGLTVERWVAGAVH
ncbi:MAG: hypothetical protein IT558_05160 [Alphaproteobacteria bacterium]|nr:hypothetical protein [Alphaproteobacteria bacterium]